MILFLDFDGVTHPQFPSKDYPDSENQRFSFLPRLESVLREFPDVRIVIASSWRKQHSLAELKAYFAPDIATRIDGMTPSEPSISAHYTFPARGIRSREAHAWLNANGESNSPWLALEDDPFNWFPDDPVIFCDDGFREREETALRTALRKCLPG